MLQICKFNAGCSNLTATFTCTFEISLYIIANEKPINQFVSEEAPAMAAVSYTDPGLTKDNVISLLYTLTLTPAVHSTSIDSDPSLEQHDITAFISGLFKKTNEEYFKKYFLYSSIKYKNIYIGKLLCFMEKLRNTNISVNAAIKRDDFFTKNTFFYKHLRSG